MRVAKIKYSFTIELGPTQRQMFHSDYKHGFHVLRGNLKHIVESAYTGIHAYLEAFIKKSSKISTSEIKTKCLKSYTNLVANFSGYWSTY